MLRQLYKQYPLSWKPVSSIRARSTVVVKPPTQLPGLPLATRLQAISASPQMEAADLSLCECQEDSYLRSLTTRVISCTALEVKQHAPGKTGKGATPAVQPKAAVGPRFAVVLERSPLFPEGGGQPTDHGSIRVTGDSGQVVEVVEVQRQGAALHHITQHAVEPGAEVEVLVDWQRRYDHMQQHTGQHVVSAVAEVLFGAHTTSWELHAEEEGEEGINSVAIDLNLETLSAQQVLQLEQRVNAEVRAALEVRMLVLQPAQDADQIQELSTSHPYFRGVLPPAHKMKGPLRLINIDGLDLNACGGTHVQRISELQLIKVLGVERAKGAARLRFVSGNRALTALSRSLARESQLTSLFSCGPATHVARVEAIMQERRDGAKARKALEEELAAMIGQQLVAQHVASVGAVDNQAASLTRLEVSSNGGSTGSNHVLTQKVDSGPGNTGSSAVGMAVQTTLQHVHSLHRHGANLEFLTLVASAAQAVQPDALLLLTSDDSNPALGKHKGDVTFLVVGDAGLAKVVGAAVAAELKGRGGGRPGKYQGVAPDAVERVDAAHGVFAKVAAQHIA